MHQLGEVVEEIRIAGAAGPDTVTSTPGTIQTQHNVIIIVYIHEGVSKKLFDTPLVYIF